MAEKRTIDININTNADEASKEFDRFGKSVNTANDSVEGLNKTFEEAYGEIQPLTTRMGEAEDRLYELAAAGDTASAEYQGLLTKVGQYRKVQIQTDLAVDAAATTMGQKLGGALTGATGGFSAVQGVMGLVGGESEQLEKALLKVQSALAIQQGVQGIREAIPAFKQLGKSAMTALKGIKTGIAATGVGLLVIAIATLVAYWDDIKEAISGVSAEQRQLNVLADADLQTQKDKLEAIGSQDNILKLQGKSERDILKLKIAQTDAVIESTKQVIEGKKIAAKLEVESLKRNQQIAETIAKVALHMAASLLRILTVPLDAVIATVNYASDFLGFGEAIGFSLGAALTDIIDKGAEAASTFLFDADAAQEEADAAIAEQEKALATLKNNRAGFQLAIKAIDKTASDESIKNAKETAAELARIQKEALDTEIDEEIALQQKLDAIKRENEDRFRTEQENELLLVEEKYDTLEAMAQGNAEALNEIDIARLNERNDINLKYDKEAYDAKKALDDKAAADKKAAEDKEISDNKALQDSKVQMANDAFGAISGLVTAFAGESEKSQRKAFKINKAISIAQAVINTAGAIGAAINPAVGGLGIPAGIPGAALAAATGIAQVATIAKTEFGGGSTGDVSPAGALAESQAPNFNVVGDSGVNQLASLQQQPTQAYVVSGDVTTAQALDRNRVQNATL
jgi:hypothetical protein